MRAAIVAQWASYYEAKARVGIIQMSDTEQIIIHDPNEIRPKRPITHKEIEEVVAKHRELYHLCRLTFEKASEIGFRLRCWHDLIPPGKWLAWLAKNIPEISERSARVYLSLWDNHAAIEAHFKSAESADLGNEPSIKSALAFLVSRRADSSSGGAKKVRRNPALPGQNGQWLTLKLEQLNALCPKCRQILEEST